MKKPNPDQSEGPERRSGQVRHDARGHAVWQWAADTARSMAITTSQVLRRLDREDLTLQDETRKSKVAQKPQLGQRPMAKPKAPVPGGGFNPYEGRAARPAARVAPAPAPKAKPKAGSPASASSRSSWWRRLFRRG